MHGKTKAVVVGLNCSLQHSGYLDVSKGMEVDAAGNEDRWVFTIL
jgi:hypothetical protein